MLGANALGALCGYLLQVFLAHRLGVASYGAVASLLALAAAILIPSQVITAIVARHSAELHSLGRLAQLNDLIRRLSAVLLVVGVGVAALFALCSGLIASFLHLSGVVEVSVVGVMFGLSFIAPINIGAVQGLQRFSWYAVLIALPFVLRLILAAALVVLGFGVGGAMSGILLGLILAYVVSFQPLRGLLAGPRAPYGSLRGLGTYSITATLTLTMTVVLGNWDTPLAKHYLTPGEAGLYAAMAIIGKTMMVVSNSVAGAMFPRFAVLHSRGERAMRAVWGAIWAVLGPCLALQALFLAAPVLIMKALYGASYVSVASQLPFYGASMLLLGVAQVLIYYFLSRDGRLFILAVLAGGALQGLLFEAWHRDVAQLVQASLVGNGVLVAVLLMLLIAPSRGAAVET
jgi:O-antigen/teichoic acid export membrane protein